MIPRWAAAFSWLTSAACVAPSAEQIKRDFEAYAGGAGMCTVASECVVVSPGCPLGCFVAVRGDRRADVEAKARDLIGQYERGGASCDYECVTPGVISCTAGRCAVEIGK